MSDKLLIFVSTKPDWRPLHSADKAVELVRLAYPNAENVDAKTHEAIQFIDQGQNFEDVRCPKCKHSLMEEFGELMNESYDEGAGGFGNLEIIAPCCGSNVCLNDLEFEAPAAFGSFQIDVMNPDSGDVPDELLSILERELGTSVRTVWCHI